MRVLEDKLEQLRSSIRFPVLGKKRKDLLEGREGRVKGSDVDAKEIASLRLVRTEGVFKLFRIFSPLD